MYANIPTAQIVAVVHAQLAARGLTGTERTLSRGKSTRHLTRVEVKGVPGADALGGLLPSVDIINSHRGECAIRLEVGLTRLVCSNGLRIGSSFFTTTARHVAGPRLEAWIRDLERIVSEALDAALRLVAEANRLAAIPLPVEVSLQVVTALTERGVLSEAQARRARYSLILPKREQDQGDTVWTAWNIINEARRGSRGVSPASLSADPEIYQAVLGAAA